MRISAHGITTEHLSSETEWGQFCGSRTLHSMGYLVDEKLLPFVEAAERFL
jgi:hypothetical protein